MITKNDLLIEVMHYCCRGNCYKCSKCTIVDKCLTDDFYDDFYETIPCNHQCNDTCETMTTISFWLIDENKY